jgi:hypothetical protein
MAEKEYREKEEVTEKVAPTHHAVKAEAVAAVAPRRSRQWVIGIVAIVVVVYLMLMVGGLWIFHVVANNRNGMMNNTDVTASQHMDRQGFGMRGDQTYNITQSNSDGLTTTTTNTTYTQTQGVVTAVNGDSIVVAGGGKTQTIKTNTATTYANDVKAVVNDTVVVVGTKDGDTITATQVAVYN